MSVAATQKAQQQSAQADALHPMIAHILAHARPIAQAHAPEGVGRGFDAKI